MSGHSEYYIDSLIIKCEEILDTDYDEQTQKEIDELMEEMEGFKYPLMCTSSLEILKERTPAGIRKVKGWLKANHSSLTQISGSTTVKAEANSNAIANVSITMSQSIKALNSCNLSPEEIKDIKAAIADLSAEEKSNPEKVCEKAIKVLDLAKKGADTVKAVAPFVSSMLSSL